MATYQAENVDYHSSKVRIRSGLHSLQLQSLQKVAFGRNCFRGLALERRWAGKINNSGLAIRAIVTGCTLYCEDQCRI